MVRLNPRLILACTLIVTAGLMAGSLATRRFEFFSVAWRRLFNLGDEATLAPWYNGSLLLAAGLVAGLRAMALRAAGSTPDTDPWRAYALLAAGLVFLSCDEVAQIHETISGGMRRQFAERFGGDPQTGGPWGTLTVGGYAVVVLALAAIFWRDTLALLREHRGRTALFVGAALVAIGGVVLDRLPAPEWYRKIGVLEDGAEMIGSSLILYAVLLKLGTVQVRVDNPPPLDRAGARVREPGRVQREAGDASDAMRRFRAADGQTRKPSARHRSAFLF